MTPVNYGFDKSNPYSRVEGRKALVKRGDNKTKIIVGLGSCGIAAGGLEVYQAIEEQITKMKLSVSLGKTGCLGMCYKEVLVEVVKPGQKRIIYGRVTPQMIPRILEEHILNDKIIEEWVVLGDDKKREDDTFFAKQKKIVLRNCGKIAPEEIEDYIENEGYQALRKALKSSSPDEVIETILKSGLRGRGGAGFPTGKKWRFTREARGDKKYVICNADEGDPGAFMDRSVLEGDPHSVIEGMIIAGFAIGAEDGYIYVRAEYPLAIHRLKIALSQAEELGFLGKNILGSRFSFQIKIKEGAGAFVCGEETALIASIEGKRGMPRLRPPFPAISGLWGRPTNINNVETLANVPWIILNGAEEYSGYGTEGSKGTKVFALAGKVKRVGLVEVPMGITLKEVLFDLAGGIRDNRQFKAVQIGGPSGGCLPASLLDTPVDYESVNKTGAIMGSGGMVVMDSSTCMVDVTRFFLDFVQDESCGKCVPCRLGTKRMLEILNRITQGEGKMEDLETLERLAKEVRVSSLCGLGQTAPNPVLTTLKYFRDEYEAHIKDKKCPAGVCKALLTYSINPEKCTGCGLCAKVCKVGAIS
ncbi:MAG: NADH-quinone oxidoreductase subunit NuoF, partial [Armatimonadetes bacterium CG07_land_8_20_14_0_80_40_9]